MSTQQHEVQGGMSDEEEVKKKWAASYARKGYLHNWLIWSHGGVGRTVIGRGEDEASAWADARRRTAEESPR